MTFPPPTLEDIGFMLWGRRGATSSERADAALAQGDRFNFNLWCQIAASIAQLQKPKSSIIHEASTRRD